MTTNRTDLVKAVQVVQTSELDWYGGRYNGLVSWRRIRITAVSAAGSPELGVGDEGYLASSAYFEPAVFLRDDGVVLFLLPGDDWDLLLDEQTPTLGDMPSVQLHHDTTMWNEGFEIAVGPHAFAILDTEAEAQDVAQFARTIRPADPYLGWTVEVISVPAWATVPTGVAKQLLADAASLFQGI